MNSSLTQIWPVYRPETLAQFRDLAQFGDFGGENLRNCGLCPRYGARISVCYSKIVSLFNKLQSETVFASSPAIAGPGAISERLLYNESSKTYLIIKSDQFPRPYFRPALLVPCSSFLNRRS